MAATRPQLYSCGHKLVATWKCGLRRGDFCKRSIDASQPCFRNCDPRRNRERNCRWRKIPKMNSTGIILRFLAFLAEVRSMFRQVHLFAEKSNAFRAVSTDVIPFRGEESDYAQDGVTISIALNAELRAPIDSEKKALGFSLLLRHVQTGWIAEAEIGWSGEMVGWDSFDSREAKAASIEEVVGMVSPLVEWMGARFREEVAKLPQ